MMISAHQPPLTAWLLFSMVAVYASVVYGMNKKPRSGKAALGLSDDSTQ